METLTGTKRNLLARCPDWDTCEYKKCLHAGFHTPNINCFKKTEGSIRLEECPDCRVEGK